MTTHPPGVKLVYDHFARMAVDIFNDRAEFLPKLFAVYLNASHEKITDIALIDSLIVIEFFRNHERGRLLQLFVRTMLEQPGLLDDKTRLPNFIVQINEAWQVRSNCPKQTGPLSEHPDRREVILVMLHSLDATAIGHCPIHDAPNRHAEYAPLGKYTTIGGRMTMRARKVH